MSERILEGKVAVVTGASRGGGRAIALVLGEAEREAAKRERLQPAIDKALARRAPARELAEPYAIGSLGSGS